MKNKLIDVLGSNNARVSIVSIILLLFQYNGINVDENAQSIVDLFTGQSLMGALAVITVNFLHPAMKLAQKIINKEFQWRIWLISNNLQTQAATLLSIILGAFMNNVTAGMVVSLLLQVLNFVKHLADPAKNTTSTPQQ